MLMHHENELQSNQKREQVGMKHFIYTHTTMSSSVQGLKFKLEITDIQGIIMGYCDDCLRCKTGIIGKIRKYPATTD